MAVAAVSDLGTNKKALASRGQKRVRRACKNCREKRVLDDPKWLIGLLD